MEPNVRDSIPTEKSNKQGLDGWLILSALVLLGLALRLFHLGSQSLWYDEGYSVYLAGKGLVQITVETAKDIQPPLYYYLLHGWMLLVGNSEAAVRSLSLLFGLLSLPLFYLLGRQLFSHRTGLLSAGLAALSPLYIWYAQETRMYTLLVALTLWSSYLLWLALTEQDPLWRKRKWAGAVVALVLALYTHYFAFFVLVFQVLYVLIGWWAGWHRFRPREGLVALLAALIAYAPWLPYLFTRYESDVSYWTGQLKLDEAIRKVGISFSVGESVVEGTGQWLALGFGLVLLICLAALLLPQLGRPQASYATCEEAATTAGHPRLAGVVFLLLYLVVPVALLLATTYRTPKFSPRYAMVASAPFFILIAAGLDHLFRARLAWARGVAVVVALFVGWSTAYADFNAYFDIRFTKPDFRGAIRWVETHQNTDEVVILTSGHAYPVFTYYYGTGSTRGRVPPVPYPADNWYPLPAERTLSTTNTLNYGVAKDLNRFLSGKRGVWLVLWQHEVVDPNGYLTALLDQYAEPQPVEGSFYHVRLRHYSLAPDTHFPEEPQITRPMTVNFGNEVTLLGYSPSLTQTLFLYWQAQHPLTQDYKVSLHLKDATGHTWNRSDRDRRLAALLYPTTRWRPGEVVSSRYEIPPLPGTPPGAYDLEATVYVEGAPQALDVLDELGAPRGKMARLGSVILTEPQSASKSDFPLSSQTGPSTGNHAGAPQREWGGQVALLGYQQDRQEAQAGDQVQLALFWEALKVMPTDYELHVGWTQAGKPIASQPFPPTGKDYPTSRWKAGDLLRGQYSLDVPLSIQAGPAEVQVGLFTAQDTPAPFNQWFLLTSLNIQPTRRVFVAPEIQHKMEANFGDMLTLLGANVSAEQVKAGDSLSVMLYWKALARMETSYTVFVHLLDAESRVQAQEDRLPAGGNRPTTGWVPGEVIEDSYSLNLKPDVAPGDYALEVGAYNANDPAFPRLSVIEGGQPKDNRAIVAHVRVVR